MRRPRTAALALALLLCGCGNDRLEPESVKIEVQKGSRTVRYPAAGLTVDLPPNVSVSSSTRPGVFRGTLGESYVATFAYPRREQLPRNDKELAVARRRLVAAAKKRGRPYRLISSRATEVGGARAIELLGTQTLSNRALRIRSLHVFKGRAEYVVELAAPEETFADRDRAIFPLIRRTLRVTGTVRSG